MRDPIVLIVIAIVPASFALGGVWLSGATERRRQREQIVEDSRAVQRAMMVRISLAANEWEDIQVQVLPWLLKVGGSDLDAVLASPLSEKEAEVRTELHRALTEARIGFSDPALRSGAIDMSNFLQAYPNEVTLTVIQAGPQNVEEVVKGIQALRAFAKMARDLESTAVLRLPSLTA